MKILKFSYGSIILTVLVGLFLGACDDTGQTVSNVASNAATAVTKQMSLPKYKFNSDGELLRISSDNYRRWIYVGTPLTPNELNPPEAAFPEFHNVYIHPDDYDYWAKNGEWQDGTILVKELALVGKTSHVSGKGYFQGEFTGLEATIKDKKRFADEPGNWAYFSFGHEYPLAETASAFPTSACNSCHQGNAADDFVFTQDYPVLRAAKNSMNKSTGYLQKEGFPLKNAKKLDEIEKKEVSDFLAGN